jgi:predicted aldo/keto reductase-like oxidoreductase
VIHTPDVPPRSKRKQSKRAKASGSVDDSRMEVMVEQILIKLTNHIDTSLSKHMDKVADVSAQVTWTIFCMLLSAEMHLYTA